MSSICTSACETPKSSCHAAFKRVHSPYSVPVICPQEMTESNRNFYGVSYESESSEPSDAGAPGGILSHSGNQSESEAWVPTPTYARRSPPPPLGSSPPTTTTPRVLTRHVQYNQPVPAPAGAAHVALAGKVEFIVPPPINPLDHPTPTFQCYRLFLGQIRFETTAAELRWLIRHISGVTALKVEPRGIGCFLAYFRTPEEMLHVKTIHKRVLFDHTGVWFARTPQQIDEMHHYVYTALSNVGRGFRLPKDMMIVEEEKLSVKSKHAQQNAQRSNPAPAYGGPSQMSQMGNYFPPEYQNRSPPAYYSAECAYPSDAQYCDGL